MAMTPRRLAGVLHFSQLVRRQDLIEQINAVALGSRAERKSLKKALQDLAKEL